MKRVAYYTCYFGGDRYIYSKLIPPIPSQTEDCYYFTNNNDIYKSLENTKWIRIFMPEILVHNDPILDAMASKEIRTCPHHFEVLKGYTYLVWFDSKLKVYEDVVNSYITYLDNSNESIVLTKHPYSGTYKTVWDEYNLAITYPRYALQKHLYKAYIEAKLAEGYPESIDVFYCGGFSIRKSCEVVREFGEEWLKNIQQCGIEDQISLQFIIPKYAEHIKGLKYQETWKYSYE